MSDQARVNELLTETPEQTAATAKAAQDIVLQARAACPICAEEGNTKTRKLHALRGHLMKDHTIDQLVYQIAGEAVIDALDEEEQPKFATGGVVKGSGRLVAGNGVDCVFPFTADAVRAANPSPAIDPQALAEAVAEGTIAELDRQGRLRF